MRIGSFCPSAIALLMVSMALRRLQFGFNGRPARPD